MIRANELRIGNITNFGKVIGVYPEGSTGQPQIIFDMFMTDESNVEPILLTEEWFLKFGCRKINDHTYVLGYIHNTLIIDKCKDDFDIQIEDDRGFITIASVKYVHHLQNLYFALAGQELVLK